MNDTELNGTISAKDARKILRAGRLLQQILSKLPPELTKGGFDSESGRRAIESAA